eukprot:Pgem_evm1s6658
MSSKYLQHVKKLSDYVNKQPEYQRLVNAWNEYDKEIEKNDYAKYIIEKWTGTSTKLSPLKELLVKGEFNILDEIEKIKTIYSEFFFNEDIVGMKFSNFNDNENNYALIPKIVHGINEALVNFQNILLNAPKCQEDVVLLKGIKIDQTKIFNRRYAKEYFKPFKTYYPWFSSFSYEGTPMARINTFSNFNESEILLPAGLIFHYKSLTVVDNFTFLDVDVSYNNTITSFMIEPKFKEKIPNYNDIEIEVLVDDYRYYKGVSKLYWKIQSFFNDKVPSSIKELKDWNNYGNTLD